MFVRLLCYFLETALTTFDTCKNVKDSKNKVFLGVLKTLDPGPVYLILFKLIKSYLEIIEEYNNKYYRRT